MKKLLSLTLLAIAISAAQAEVIVVTNGDFSASTYDSGDDGTAQHNPTFTYHGGSFSETNFTLLGYGAGDINGAVGPFPGGNNTAFVFVEGAGSIASGSLAPIVAGDSYVLTVDVGVEPGSTSGDTTLRLQANGSDVAGATSTDAPSISPAAGAFTTYSFTLSGAETLLLNGQLLTFRADVTGPNSDQTLFDNVTLQQFSVPEPSTYALIGLGFVGLLAVRRFRNLSKI